MFLNFLIKTACVDGFCRAVYKSNCFHKNGHSADCSVFTTSYMVVFGVVQVFFSQLQSLHEVAWLSVLAAVMSFSYSAIAVGLSLAQTISGNLRRTHIFALVLLLILMRISGG